MEICNREGIGEGMKILLLLLLWWYLLLMGCADREKQKQIDLLSNVWIKTNGCVFAISPHFGNTATYQFLAGSSDPECPLLKGVEKNAKKEGSRDHFVF